MTEPVEHRRARLAARAATYTNRVAHLRTLRDEATAELCSHGVPNCTAHRDTEPTDDRPEETTEETADA